VIALAAAAVVVGLVLLVVTPGGHRRGHSVTVPGPAPTAMRPALAAPAGEAFGVSVNRLFNDLSYTQPEINAQLAAVRASGATVARSDALWEATEPSAPVGGVHHYVWSFDDQIAGSLAAHGLTWLPIIDYTAPWAESVSGQDHSPPRPDDDYAAYAAAFAARYGPGGAFWRAHPGLAAAPVSTIEIWNEPDNGEFWIPAPSAAGYAALYLAARTAIDAVNPQIRVVVGGLTDPAVFLPAMVRAEPALAGHVDGVAIHPYGRPTAVLGKVRAARATLDGLGMAAVPLYITEFGWTTDPPTAPDYAPAATRPADILRTVSALGHLDCGIAAALLYTWVTPEHDRSDSQDWYGIANRTDPAAGTADTAAFTAGLAAAAHPAATSTPCAG
jgi:hypothetical protein